ncbi:hypothetical protein JCM10212_000928 [Sporobolomyces blumeae]
MHPKLALALLFSGSATSAVAAPLLHPRGSTDCAPTISEPTETGIRPSANIHDNWIVYKDSTGSPVKVTMEAVYNELPSNETTKLTVSGSDDQYRISVGTVDSIETCLGASPSSNKLVATPCEAAESAFRSTYGGTCATFRDGLIVFEECKNLDTADIYTAQGNQLWDF